MITLILHALRFKQVLRCHTWQIVFFCIPVCRECSLHNAAIYEDYINNNWSSDSGDTMILYPCCHQLHQQHFDSSEEILGLEQEEDIYENIKVEPEDDDGDEISK